MTPLSSLQKYQSALAAAGGRESRLLHLQALDRLVALGLEHSQPAAEIAANLYRSDVEHSYLPTEQRPKTIVTSGRGSASLSV